MLYLKVLGGFCFACGKKYVKLFRPLKDQSIFRKNFWLLTEIIPIFYIHE